MDIEMKDYQGRKVLALSGDIDMYTSPALRKELMLLVSKRVSPLLIDLESVTYIDSSGIATFVEGLKGVMSFGGSLRLASIPPSIMEIFNFSKLDKVFEIYGNIEDALNR